jgi:glycosyltransferase involved in cell wall biosynthesis
MAPARPLVTVVVAAHDAARHLGGALASLGRQTVDDLEVVVVDDGSTDGTAEVAGGVARRDGRFRLVRLGRNRGQAAALNVGLEGARGRYLAILDADDEAEPERLAVQVAALERDRDLVLVGGAVATFCDRHGVPGPTWRYAAGDAEVRVRTLFKSEVISGAITMDGERTRGAGLRFDETLRLGVDWAMCFAALRAGRVGNVEPVVLRYRIHSSQVTVGMMDDLASDSTRIRREVLAWAGLRPTEEELRIHLAISPCNYWPLGAHPYFRARWGSIREEAARWLDRMGAAVARSGRLPSGPLRAYAGEILAGVERVLERPRSETEAVSWGCPVAVPRACVAADPCR